MHHPPISSLLSALTATLPNLPLYPDIRSPHYALTGLGKSYLVACKSAATWASLSLPARPLHAVDALHGDIGGTPVRETALIAISHSGRTQELLDLISQPWRWVVAITSDPESPLAGLADSVFPYVLPKGEGSPHDLAPMASSALQMVIADGLGGSLAARDKITPADFLANHPAGSLGCVSTWSPPEPSPMVARGSRRRAVYSFNS